jgi:hypothetical protein
VKHPTDILFLLAESVREEHGGKLSILGLYTGNQVVLHGELPTSLPEGMNKFALPHLAIVLVFKGGEGDCDVKVEIVDPLGKRVLAGTAQVSMAPDAVRNVLLPLSPFPIAAFGEHQFKVRMGRRTYKYPFVIRHSDPTQLVPLPAAAEAIKRGSNTKTASSAQAASREKKTRSGKSGKPRQS